MAQNFPIPDPSDAKDSFDAFSRKFNNFVSSIFKIVNALPRQTPNGIDLPDVFQSLRQSYHLFASRWEDQRKTSFTARANYFILRVFTVFRHPSQFATIFLDFCLLVYSFWDRRLGRRGPDFILPMSSLSRRPSCRLSRLLVQHSRDLPQYEPEVETSLPESNSPLIVAVIDLCEVSQHNYSTGADIYGLTSMLILILILNVLLTPSWLITLLALQKVLAICGWAFMNGDGTLTLLQQSETCCAPTPAYAILFDEDFSVVLRGTQELLDAITLGGFQLSYPVAGLFDLPVWKYVVHWLLEGFFQGLLYLMGILPVWRLLQPSFTSHLSQLLGPFALFQCFTIITSWPTIRQIIWHPKTLDGMVLILTEIPVEALRSGARVAPLLVSWYLYIHDYALYNELQLLLDTLPSLCTMLILSIPTQNYPIRTPKFLNVLGNTSVRKWQFHTPAAAATFQCLVLCHGISRPVKSVDVGGVLDTLITDQRDVWRAWKARVADRITHEEDIIFAPTLPTFRDMARQRRLKAYLDEAQHAYEAYRHLQYLN
ncbi:hypothetical protein J3R82DRAFT_3440 [Butyriboletus roseoflavus]|nr:hypothetical protein J3R82DRAFT_7462 [Butyriboletus roseoflavus]KAG8220346.1 hypothetical protein J3R82DRAFT_3440 [Butyriboletus roseoflavus]